MQIYFYSLRSYLPGMPINIHIYKCGTCINVETNELNKDKDVHQKSFHLNPQNGNSALFKTCPYMSKLGSLLIAPQIKLEQFAYLFYDYLQNNWIGFKYSPYCMFYKISSMCNVHASLSNLVPARLLFGRLTTVQL